MRFDEAGVVAGNGGQIARFTARSPSLTGSVGDLATGLGWCSGMVGRLPTLRNDLFTRFRHFFSMSNYRRARVPGATYFFTVNLAERGGSLLTDHVDALRGAYLATSMEHPVICDAMVVLPDHLHAVWTLPEGDADFSLRWRKIKARFSRSVGVEVPRSASKVGKRERGIWQRRFWEHLIRDAADYRAHVEYCWGNPVKHGFVARAVDWPYSSIHRDVRAGKPGAEWVGRGWPRVFDG